MNGSPLTAVQAMVMQRIERARRSLPAIARGSGALIFATFIASGLGMVFWAVAARMLSPEQLGIGAALIAVLTALSHAAQLNLRNLLHRFLPGAGHEATKLVNVSYVLAAVVAVVLGGGYVFAAGSIATDLAFLGQSPVTGFLFVAALTIWTLYSLQESILTALRMAGLVPIQSLAYSVAKIACLAALASSMAVGGAILAAWIVPALLVGLATHTVARRRLAARPSGTHPKEVVGWRQLLSFFGWDYVGSLASSISFGVAPIMVVSFAGAAATAPYYLAWSITFLLYLASRHVGAAMLSELWSATTHRRSLYAEAVVLTILPVTCGAVFLMLLAPQIMLIFGAHYAAFGADILPVLSLASIPGAATAIYLAICRAEGWVRRIALLQLTVLAGVVALGAPLTALIGPIGMAWGWFAAYSVAVLLILVIELSRVGPVGALDFVVDLISAAQRFWHQAGDLLRTAENERSVRAAVVSVGGRNWSSDSTGPVSRSDASMQRLVSTDSDRETAVLKRATTPKGREALYMEYAALTRLNGDDTVRRILDGLIPRPLLFERREDGTAVLLMSTLNGTDARTAATESHRLAPALVSTIATLARLHATRRTEAESSAWRTTWIDAPLARLREAMGERSVSALSDEMQHYWGSAAVCTGPGHGDLSPGNLMIERDRYTGEYALSGLVDWGGFRADAPQGLDACTLAITLRATSSGRQLGQVVLELLSKPRWTAAERQWLASSGSAPWMVEPGALRSMVLLAWLQHVDGNLIKSTRYSGTGMWGLVNIRLVLEGLTHVPR